MRLARCSVVFALALANVACTEILGIDGSYGLSVTSAGGSSGMAVVAGAGGHAGNPVAVSGSGGVAGSRGGRDAGVVKVAPIAVDAAAPDSGPLTCAPGEKICIERCVVPDPSVGCAPTGCEPCAKAPENAFGVCTGEHCAFECVTGFEKNAAGTGCKSTVSGSGGSGSTDGGHPPTGNSPGYFQRCTQEDTCPPCGVFTGCCNPIQHCGCLYVAACI